MKLILNKLSLFLIFAVSYYCSAAYEVVHLNRENLFNTCWYQCTNQSQVILLYSKNISTIDSNTFVGLVRLEELQLQYNLLKSLEPNTFDI